MDELSHYLSLFNKGDFKSFPRVKVDWDRNYYSLCLNIENNLTKLSANFSRSRSYKH
jgi:hypothetical protein